jgi:hypothetical protein
VLVDLAPEVVELDEVRSLFGHDPYLPLRLNILWLLFLRTAGAKQSACCGEPFASAPGLLQHTRLWKSI